MYFSVGWPDVLRPRDADAGEPLVIKSCDNQALFAVLSARSLFIWTSKVSILKKTSQFVHSRTGILFFI